MQGGQRAWPGSGPPGSPLEHPPGIHSGWMRTAPPPFVFVPPVPQVNGSRVGRQQLSSLGAEAAASAVTPPTFPNIPSSYRQNRRASDRSLYAPVDRRVIVQAAGSPLRRRDYSGSRVYSEATAARHSDGASLRSPASRLDQHGVAALHRSSSVSANRVTRHTAGPSNQRLPSHTMGRSRSGSSSRSTTRLTAGNLFDERSGPFTTMDFMDGPTADSGLPRLPSAEEMERRMRSFESSFLGVSAFPYTNMRGVSSTVGVPFISALQRPRSNATDHRSRNYEPRSPVSVIDERYMWSGDGTRPRRSSGDSSVFLRSSERSQGSALSDNLFGESLGARLHSSAAANMIRSFISSLIGPAALPWRAPWDVRMELLTPTSHRTEYHSHSRRIIGTPSPSLVLFAAAAANPANFDVLEHNIGRFIDEIERSIGFDDFDDLDSPLMVVVSGGNAGDGDDFVPHIWADASGNGVTLQQLSEARSLRENLGQHTLKWTFGEDKHGDGHSTVASHGTKAPAGSSGGKAQQTQRGLGRLDSPTDAATDSSAAGAESETHNGYDCCICLSAFEPGDVLLTLRCLHIFHERCIDRWIRTSHSVKCPLCSTKIAESPDSEPFGA